MKDKVARGALTNPTSYQKSEGEGDEGRRPTFNNRIHRTAFLAVPAIYALGHVDVVACGAAAAIFALFRFNSDCQRRTDLFFFLKKK
jgi:hypothetical protein